jgi:hypothetical protein
MYVVSLDLRLSYVLKMWIIDLLRDYQILLCNWVVIKVVLDLSGKACCEAWSVNIEFVALYLRDISAPLEWLDQKMYGRARLSVNL